MEFNLSMSSQKIENRDFDAVIIGSGAAGMSAAVYAARSGLKVVILDQNVAGGLTAEAPLVENYLGFKAIKGTDLASNFAKHAQEYAQIIDSTQVTSVKQAEKGFSVETSRGEFTCRSVIVATGTSHKHLGVPGENEYYSRGLSYCSTCDGYLFKGKRVIVIGGGNSGAIAAISMSEYTSSVTVLEYMDHYMCEKAYEDSIKSRKIKYITNAQVMEIVGDRKKVTGVRYRDRNSKNESVVETDGVFIYVGLVPQTDFLKSSGVELSDRGYIVTDRKGRTSVAGIYAAGDVVKDTEAQIATAVGDGCRASLAMYGDMVRAGKR